MSAKLRNSNTIKYDTELARVVDFIDRADEQQFGKLEEYMEENSEEIHGIAEDIYGMAGPTKLSLKLSKVPNVFFAKIQELRKRILSNKSTRNNRDDLRDFLFFHREHDEFRFISFLFNFVNRLRGGLRKTQKAAKKTVEINGGEKFRIEDPSKNWTLTPRYKKWVGKLTHKTRGKRHTKAEDLCVGKDNICDGDLGIARKYMPQFIGKDDVRKFRNFIKRVYGVKSRVTRRKAKELKPTQKEISRSRIEDLIENEQILKKVLVPLVTSNDNYVVDGHHRWAAYRLKKPNKSLPVVEIDAPIKDVLGISIAWGAKHQDF